MARKKVYIDWDKIEQLLVAGASGAEAAAFIGIDRETLYKRCKSDLKMDFSEYRRSKLEKGDASLRVKQYGLAMNGDRTMLVWLGKNRLKQTDKIEQKVEADIVTSTKVILPELD